MDYASSLFLDSLNNESVSSSSAPKEEEATTSSSSSCSASSPDKEEETAPVGLTSVQRSASGEALLSAEARDGGEDAADSDTETDMLETVKPLIGDSPDSREDGSYR